MDKEKLHALSLDVFRTFASVEYALRAANDNLEAAVTQQAEVIKELRDEFRAYKAAHP